VCAKTSTAVIALPLLMWPILATPYAAQLPPTRALKIRFVCGALRFVIAALATQSRRSIHSLFSLICNQKNLFLLFISNATVSSGVVTFVFVFVARLMLRATATFFNTLATPSTIRLLINRCALFLLEP
jgi:hypothetical protein